MMYMLTIYVSLDVKMYTIAGVKLEIFTIII